VAQPFQRCENAGLKPFATFVKIDPLTVA
jgi:hypothetical protein